MKVCISELTSALKSGSPFLYPTETLMALGANPFVKGAGARVNAMKERPDNKVLPMIADSDFAQDAFDFSTLNEELLGRAKEIWPGPLTLVAKPKDELLRKLCPEVVSEEGKIALRVSSRAEAQEIAKLTGGLVISTSANISGKPVIDVEHLEESSFSDLPLYYQRELNFSDTPSTIVDITKGQEKVIRAGAVAFDI